MPETRRRIEFKLVYDGPLDWIIETLDSGKRGLFLNLPVAPELGQRWTCSVGAEIKRELVSDTTYEE